MTIIKDIGNSTQNRYLTKPKAHPTGLAWPFVLTSDNDVIICKNPQFLHCILEKVGDHFSSFLTTRLILYLKNNTCHLKVANKIEMLELLSNLRYDSSKFN